MGNRRQTSPDRMSSHSNDWSRGQTNDWNDGGIGGGMDRPRHMSGDDSRFHRQENYSNEWETDQGRASYGYEPSHNFGPSRRYSDEGSFGRGDQPRYGHGPHAGRGPKNYQRSDERIREDVSDSLTDDPDVDATEITVEARDGEVTLSGTVQTREEKRCAEACAEEVSGVRDVINQLRVSRGSSGEPSMGGNSGGTGGRGQSGKGGRSSSES
jgi:osmotically-inducible protein OsmY